MLTANTKGTSTYPTIVILMQDSHDLANLQLELVIHRGLELKLNTVNSISGTIASRSSTCEGGHGDDRSHTDLSLGLGTRSCGRAEIEASCSRAGHGATLELDWRTEGTLFRNR